MSGQLRRVLVVDDEPQIRRFLRTSLEREGYEVIEAESGARGARRGGARPKPDIVMLDLGLPDSDGHRACCGGSANGRRCRSSC